jgi:hypothetical protein
MDLRLIVASDTAAHRLQTKRTRSWKASSTDEKAIGHEPHLGHFGKNGLLSMGHRARKLRTKNVRYVVKFLEDQETWIDVGIGRNSVDRPKLRGMCSSARRRIRIG